MISTNQFKNGITFQLDGKIYQIIEFQHVKPGKGGAFVRTKLRDIKNNSVISKTYRSGEKFDSAYIDQKKLQYLYNADGVYYFMDINTYEQMHFTNDMLGRSIDYLKEEMEVNASFCEGSFIELSLPVTVVLKVDHTEPGFKGDTAKASYKPAVLETGASVQVPIFIKPGESIKVDTRTGEYLERA